ncbi:MAG: penicillin-binding transpeptidase domain-containing protein [Spirochaetota bacterium]
MTKEQKIALVTVLLAAFGSIVVFRMFFLAIRTSSFTPVSQNDVRGDIYDVNGRRLTENTPVFTLAVDKNSLSAETLAATVHALSSLTGMRTRDVAIKLRDERRFSVIRRKVTSAVRDAVLAAQKTGAMKGVYFIPERRRTYPFSDVFAHLIGFTDIDNRGIEGIEFAYDEELAPAPVLKRRNVMLTVNADIQDAVHREIKAAMALTKSDAAVVIVQNVNNGDILASVSYPYFDPNEPGRYSPMTLRNRAFMNIIEPGSTFKMLAAAFALSHNIVSANETFLCTGVYTYPDGQKIKCHEKHGRVSFEDVIKRSCNVGIITVAERFKKAEFHDFLTTFRFGEKTGIARVSEQAGILRPPRSWSLYSRGYIAIGQEIGVTPLQLIGAYSALVNGGTYHTPRLVSSIVDEERRVVSSMDPSGERVLDAAVAERIKLLLRKSVESGSTGELASLKDVAVIGKTGTSQIANLRSGGYLDDAYNSIFVGAFPLDAPRVSMLVLLNKPKGAHTGGRVAAPLFKRIAIAILPLLNIYPDTAVTVSRASLTDLASFVRSEEHISGGGTAMPMVIGLSLREALIRIRSVTASNENGISVSGEGYVLSQEPPAGETVRFGSVVRLRLSGPK